jgi:hypothetical protein
MPRRKSIVRRPSRRRSCTMQRRKSIRRGTGEPAAPVVNVVSAAPLKENDTPCKWNGECASNRCDRDINKKNPLLLLPKTCMPKIENGKDCLISEYCLSNYCHDNALSAKCKQQKEIGSKCFKNRECISNWCTNNGKFFSLPTCQVKPASSPA